MRRILVREPSTETLKMIFIGDGGGYFEPKRVLWDESSKKDIPPELKEEWEKTEKIFLEKEEDNKILLKAKAYLTSTVSYILEELETGEKCPDEIKKLRQEAREKIKKYSLS